jgi:TRAP-type C4-dicarboxylate transport system permease large subunit
MGYDKRLATSTVAVGGTLGSLIPPSVLFIVYGIFTEMSVSRLFLVGVIIIKLLEISLITPPAGLNVFVIASVTKPSVAVYDIFMGVTRFLVMDILVLVAIITFPILSLLLPNFMM